MSDKYTDGIVSIPGMALYRHDRCCVDRGLYDERVVPNRGGGVAIYVKDSWARYVTVYSEGTIITRDYEILSLKINKPGFRKLFITVVYKPPTGKIQQCLTYLEQLIATRDIRKREKWVLGDFNVNLGIRNTPESLLVNTFLKDNSLKQLIIEHTRLTNRGGSCIDWIITDCPFVKESGILEELLSDHFSIFVVRKKDREKTVKKWTKIRIYKNYDKDNFCALLANLDWVQYYAMRDVDELWNIIYVRIIEILEIMCPYKRVCLRDPKMPWVTAEVVKAINERKKYVRMYWKTKNQFIWDICKYLRNRCNTLVRNAKAIYIKNSLRRTVDELNFFWKSINNLLKGPKKDIIAHEFVDNITGEVIEQQSVCDYLNKFYANVGKVQPTNAVPKPQWNLHDIGYDFEPVTKDEVRNLVKEIDIGKDSCVDGISTSILKDGFSMLLSHLQYLFNVSVEDSVFPREWAQGFINILPKGGNLKDPSNWRPITQALLPAKLLEKLVQKRFFKILKDVNYLSRYQCGFLPQRSTQLALFDILKDINEARNSKLSTGLLFLDVRKAFDSLDHNILLTKLQVLGISGRMLTWFSSYLDRKQRVRHNGEVSDETKFCCGIPQGSCLGPTLFIFYINDVFEHIDNCIKVMMFADDCVLYKADQCINSIMCKLQKGLDEYVAWGKNNNMHMNVSKTKFMMISPIVHANLYRPLISNGKYIQKVNTFKYLGVLLDDQLTYTPYYKLIKRIVENKIFVLSKIRKYVDTRTAILIYKQAVLPLLEYAGFVLCSCSIGQRKELQKLQNNALHLCKKYYLLDMIRIDVLHNECRILGLEQRRRKQLLHLMYLHSRNDNNLKVPVRLTRAVLKLNFKTATKCTTKYLNSPFYKGTLLWNQLNSIDQRSNTVSSFVNCLSRLYNVYQEIW